MRFLFLSSSRLEPGPNESRQRHAQFPYGFTVFSDGDAHRGVPRADRSVDIVTAKGRFFSVSSEHDGKREKTNRITVIITIILEAFCRRYPVTGACSGFRLRATLVTRVFCVFYSNTLGSYCGAHTKRYEYSSGTLKNT